eukprot:14080842-Alexandrium_andersonii.AAC.1
MADGSRDNTHSRSCRGWPNMRWGAPPALQRSRRNGLRGPSSNAATLTTGTSLRKAVHRLIPALTTVAFDVLQCDFPLRFDVPQQCLGV